MAQGTADADGQFAVTRVSAGGAVVEAFADGYAPGGFALAYPAGVLPHVEIDPAQPLSGLVIRLWRSGVVAGSVVDDRDQPIAGVPITLERDVSPEDDPRAPRGGGAFTDEGGAYRIRVIPGDIASRLGRGQRAFTFLPISRPHPTPSRSRLD